MRREVSTKEVLMKEQVHLALGTSKKSVQLGNFCVKVRGPSTNVYYNMDLGNSKTKVFDLSSGTYMDVTIPAA